jgi:hypothetical protein
MVESALEFLPDLRGRKLWKYRLIDEIVKYAGDGRGLSIIK